jgi:hypothetical protein
MVVVGLRVSTEGVRATGLTGPVFLPPRSVKLRNLAAASAFFSSSFLMIF